MNPSSICKPLLLATAVLFAFPVTASAGHPDRKDDSSRNSKNGTLEATIDGVDIKLTYGRPNVKGRKIWGGLVSNDKIWRAGADEATAVTFSKDVRIEGKKLPAGTYALFAVPAAKGWTWVFNSVAEQWGAYSYDKTKDALRVDVKPDSGPHVEALTFSADGNVIQLKWEKLVVPFKVQKG